MDKQPTLGFLDHNLARDLLEYCDLQTKGRIGQTGHAGQALVNNYFNAHPYLKFPTNMPELKPLIQAGSEQQVFETCKLVRGTYNEAMALYGSQRKQYKWAVWLGGKPDDGYMRWNRNADLALCVAGATLVVTICCFANTLFRTEKLTHFKTWWKRYLLISASPTMLGLGIHLIHRFDDRRLDKAEPQAYQKALAQLSPEQLRHAGMYGLMHKEQFALACVIRRLHQRWYDEQVDAFVQAHDKDAAVQRFNQALTTLSNQSREAYWNGCYRTYCLRHLERGQQVPRIANFSLDKMLPPVVV